MGLAWEENVKVGWFFADPLGLILKLSWQGTVLASVLKFLDAQRRARRCIFCEARSLIICLFGFSLVGAWELGCYDVLKQFDWLPLWCEWYVLCFLWCRRFCFWEYGNWIWLSVVVMWWLQVFLFQWSLARWTWYLLWLIDDFLLTPLGWRSATHDLKSVNTLKTHNGSKLPPIVSFCSIQKSLQDAREGGTNSMILYLVLCLYEEQDKDWNIL